MDFSPDMFTGIANMCDADERPLSKAFGKFIRDAVAIYKKYPSENMEFLKDESKYHRALGKAIAHFDYQMHVEGGVDNTALAEFLQVTMNYGTVVDAEKGTKKVQYFMEGWNSVAAEKGLPLLE
jgi:hypothetical protein